MTEYVARPARTALTDAEVYHVLAQAAIAHSLNIRSMRINAFSPLDVTVYVDSLEDVQAWQAVFGGSIRTRRDSDLLSIQHGIDDLPIAGRRVEILAVIMTPKPELLQRDPASTLADTFNAIADAPEPMDVYVFEFPALASVTA